MSFRTRLGERGTWCSLLLARTAFFGGALFRRSRLLLRRRLRSFSFCLMCSRDVLICHVFRLYLLRLSFLLWKLGRGVRLPIECDLRNSHRTKRLPMSCDLLVLLFLLVVENENFFRAVFIKNLACYQCTRPRLRPHNLS